ncbi:NAD-dependent epimerase/dehydratase family protein [Aquimarina gracilis]|uniref:NAD-dependent epimerase/dehydratase family protein n=1 Tax=Aquimarina gracilis TaxID=874422 RepID=A0ABU5ZT23_9FLAO|nr:NAD-dependent epimerase/dehydratase family protein [Aquimarina gracilis]MEB3345245.1 NAD-dependent epimerase/dehydratase family protein [Aquimarina gracilis]
MNIFVTGGSGFVGQNIIPLLIENGHTIYALARSQKSAKKVNELGAIPVLDDLVSLSENTEEALSYCDAVVHSAAYMNFTYDKKTFYDVNVKATENLLSLSKKNKVNTFVYISAAPVIAGSPIINAKEIDASFKLPKALYPKTKAIAERKVLGENSKSFITISLRPPAIWGNNNHHYEEFFSRAVEGKWKWLGKGDQILSTIHIKNLGNAIIAALKSNKGGEAYFVTDGERRPMKDFFTAILKSQGIDPGNKSIPLSAASFLANMIDIIWRVFRIKSKPPVAPIMIRLMGREFSVNDSKARKELGYTNAISIKEGIEELYKKA